MTAKHNVSGAIYRCIRCDELVLGILDHQLAVHHTNIIAYNDFALRRGALHDPTGPRTPKTTSGEQLALGDS